MQRFYPTSRPNTLHDKVMKDLTERRFMPSATHKPELRIATILGMDDDARACLERLKLLAKSRKVGVAGHFMPDRGVSDQLAQLGILENVDEADFFQVKTVATPFCGITSRQRGNWQEAGYSVEDLTSAKVRRAQVALGLLKMEGAQALVIGRHEDPESLAISGGNSAIRILEDTNDTARLVFFPTFGAVCQTTLSPRRVSWLVQQLRLRWRDARVTFLDTLSPSMTAREEALERLLAVCDQVVIVGEAGEASCEALAETALRRGKAAQVVATPKEMDLAEFRVGEKIALTAGGFATDEAIRAVASALGR